MKNFLVAVFFVVCYTRTTRTPRQAPATSKLVLHVVELLINHSLLCLMNVDGQVSECLNSK